MLTPPSQLMRQMIISKHLQWHTVRNIKVWALFYSKLCVSWVSGVSAHFYITSLVLRLFGSNISLNSTGIMPNHLIPYNFTEIIRIKNTYLKL